MHIGAFRGASFVIGANCGGGCKKDNKSSAKIKALFLKRVRYRRFACGLLRFHWINVHLLCGPLRTSVISALKRSFDIEIAEGRRDPSKEPALAIVKHRTAV
jgi:hypothetical protein